MVYPQLTTRSRRLRDLFHEGAARVEFIFIICIYIQHNAEHAHFEYISLHIDFTLAYNFTLHYIQHLQHVLYNHGT